MLVIVLFRWTSIEINLEKRNIGGGSWGKFICLRVLPLASDYLHDCRVKPHGAQSQQADCQWHSQSSGEQIDHLCFQSSKYLVTNVIEILSVDGFLFLPPLSPIQPNITPLTNSTQIPRHSSLTLLTLQQLPIPTILTHSLNLTINLPQSMPGPCPDTRRQNLT